MKGKGRIIILNILSILILIAVCVLIYLRTSPSKFDTNAESILKTSIEVSSIKQKGAHLMGSLDSTRIQVLRNTNFNYITLVPWGFQDNYKSAKVTHHNSDSTNIESGNLELLNRIKLLKSKSYKVFIKPHVWVDKTLNGKWRSDIFPTNQNNWELWKISYRDFIFRYAKIAELGQADMFCIGTEFSRLAVEKPLFWKELINDLRKIFSGKLIYAANWNQSYEHITFWQDLDFIGVQAYFPLTDKLFPSTEELNLGWEKIIPKLDNLSCKNERKVIFTEIGYKSTSDAGIEPWKWIENAIEDGVEYSSKTQANCYESFLNTIWNEDWFAGAHIWQLRTDYKIGDEIDDLNFNIQGKSAEKILHSFFTQ